ncbi:hypothetical protein [Methanothermobacter tenebrarum]|uniref:Uncharacterized protein n=1 Tax=Methanothermobacter tenebrarum TaxID=680118 RepID=A0A328P8T9_9EURY|nr:hypothetical protein [Methanothermobacter tenebrarum]MBC7100738.1 hypothetical protein [Methanobacteriales archaeon]MBC7118248.1 hypothetical protein [Methanobacteriaceae archaeon]NPV65420.1 hypothetical protein [Methanobacteriaceae archaeon]RAO78878.1 hypothetical protein DPC56_05455 [Methanothermobacter tenebrarum]
MSRILKFFLFFLLFIIFFEVGVISSYTLVTSQPPDVEKLINTQLDILSSYLKIGKEIVGPKPEIVNITNNVEVAETLQKKAQVDGVELETLNATTFEDLENERVNVNITAMAYRENVTESTGQIVIKPTARFMITATAVATVEDHEIKVDVGTIKILSIIRVY